MRTFIRHNCPARRKTNDKAKEFYRRERCAQLKRYSAKQLGRMSASRKARNGHLNKRKAEQVDDYLATGASKLHKGIPTQGNDRVYLNSAHFSVFPSPQHEANSNQTSLLPSSSSNVASNSSSSLPSLDLPPKMFSDTQMETAYNVLMPQPYAPIFNDITITPCYDIVQESYEFSSALQSANYRAIPQHESADLR
jgi:hypothetical protein